MVEGRPAFAFGGLPWIFAIAGALGCAHARKAEAPPAETEKAAAPQEAGQPASPPEPSAEVVEGERLFKQKGCIMCHGEGGKGGVKNRYALGGLVPPLDKVAEGYTKEELKEKVEAGVPEIAKEEPEGHVPILIMPSWKDKLSHDELDRIIDYLFSLAPKTEGGQKEEW